MRRYIIFLMALCAFMPVTQAQVRIRDVFATAPDSIFPLLTKNNRLDCLDFKENNMAARVKNRMDDATELKVLTEGYLQLQMSAHSTVEMRMLGDSLFCLINTYLGPAADSRVRFFDTEWKPVEMALPRPRVEDFWNAVPDSLAQDARFARQSLEALRLVQVSASPDDAVLTLTLQTTELAEKEKEVAQQYVHPLRYLWDGQAFVSE
jgi:hypothetical protein